MKYVKYIVFFALACLLLIAVGCSGKEPEIVKSTGTSPGTIGQTAPQAQEGGSGTAAQQQVSLELSAEERKKV